MSERVAILTAGDEEVFVDLLEHFPPEHYALLFGDGLAQVRPLYEAHAPRLLVVRLDGTGWQLTPILREAHAKQIPVLGLSAGADSTWIPSPRDRHLPPRPTAPVIEAAKELLGERRRFARTPLQLPLDLGDGNEAVATISSAGSLFVPTDRPRAVGAKLELGIAYEGTELRCVSPVVRVEMDPDHRGMVLVVPEGRARNLIDAIVRRMLLSEHYRQLAEQRTLDPAVGAKIAARARRILLEAVAGAADDEEAEPARLVVTQSTQPPQTFEFPAEFSIPSDELEAAWAGSIELSSDLSDAIEAEVRTSAPDVQSSSPDLATAAEPPTSAAQPAAATPVPEAEPPQHTPTTLPPFDELSPTDAGVFPTRKPMRTPSAVSAVALDAGDPLHALAARIAGLEGHVERIAETRPTREELQRQIATQQRVNEAVDALRTRVEDTLKELGARVDEQQRQVREHAAEQLARQAALQAEALARAEARMGRSVRSTEETLAVQRDAVVELGERMDAVATRELDAGAAADEEQLDALRTESARQAQAIEDHEQRLTHAVAWCEELGEELSRQQRAGREAQEQLGQRLEVHAALVESFETRIEELSQLATRATVDLERAREERAQLRRQLEGVAANIARLKDQFVEQRGALLVFQSDLQRIQTEQQRTPGAAPDADDGDPAATDLPRSGETSLFVTQLELRDALDRAQAEWRRHGTGETPQVDGAPPPTIDEDSRGETPR